LVHPLSAKTLEVSFRPKEEEIALQEPRKKQLPIYSNPGQVIGENEFAWFIEQNNLANQLRAVRVVK
jgi:hypothetical protein